MNSDTATVVQASSKPQLASNHRIKLWAFLAKYEGNTHKEIAQMIGCPESTIATYFSREWRMDYQDFADEEDAIRLEMVRNILKHKMIRAAKELTNLVLSHDPRIRLAACKEVLDRTVGKDFIVNELNDSETLTLERLRIEKKRASHYEKV
ncbi:MAG TPA: hypothetical protein VL989_01485 [Candidatus Sulfotelmatobacter sp.]|nr:hypothetical protein [Candidatus Sulfotelmatobacter sp.]